MIINKIRLCSLLRAVSFSIVVLMLAACGSTPKANKAVETNKDGDVQYQQSASEFMAKPRASKVHSLFVDYVASNIPSNIWDIRDEFEAIQQQIANGDSCSRYDWDALIRENIMRLQRHISAIECYQSLDNDVAVQKHSEIFESLVSGVSLHKSGSDYTSAYEVLTEDDAEEFLAFAGYRIIAMEYELVEGDDGLYLVYTVESEETGKQEQIYFDHRRYIHRFYGVPYPFSANPVLFSKTFLPEMKNHNAAAPAGLGDGYIINWGDTAGATKQYLTSIAWGNIPASHKLAEACLNYELPELERLECVNLLVDAAEGNYMKSVITLAYLYHEGVVVEADPIFAKELVEFAATKLPKGEAHWQFFKLVLSKPFTNDYIAVNPYQFAVDMPLKQRFEQMMGALTYLAILSEAINEGSEVAKVFKDFYLPPLGDGFAGSFGHPQAPKSNEAIAWMAKGYLTMFFNIAAMNEAELLAAESDISEMQREYAELAKQDARFKRQPNYGVFKGLALAEAAENNMFLAAAEYAFYHIAAVRHSMLGKSLMMDWLHNNKETSFAKAIAKKHGGYDLWLKNCTYHNLYTCIYFDAENRFEKLPTLSSSEEPKEMKAIVLQLLQMNDDDDALKLLQRIIQSYPEARDIVIAEGYESLAEKL